MFDVGFMSKCEENDFWVCFIIIIIKTEIFSAVSQALAQKARDGKLLPEEYQGGSFR